ncbi:MAG: hypothetical protein ACSW8I_10350, partial [bacterium]
MKKNLFIFSVCLVCFYNARSQTDTVSYPDPWYLFRPYPDTSEVYPNGSFLNGGYCFHYLQSFYADIPVDIYGIACVVDTLHINQENPDIGFRPMLYRYEDEGNPPLNYRYFKMVDSLSFNSYIRRCKFKYAYSSVNSDHQRSDTVFNCYEFYFNRPYRSDSINNVSGYQDSVYVGRYWDCNPASVPFGEVQAMLKSVSISNNIIPHYQAQAQSYGQGVHSSQLAFYNADGWDGREWGPFFPIVRLRCVQPELRLGRNWYDTTVVSWRTVEAPDGYELSLGD